LLFAEQRRRRLDQTASRLRSLAYPELVAPERLLVSEATGRIGPRAAAGLSYRAADVGEEFGPLWATYWFQVELAVPREWAGKAVELVWDSGCEATVWRDDVPLQGLGSGGRAPRTRARLASAAEGGERIGLRVEMACNPWTGSPLPPIPGLDPAEIEARRLGPAWVEADPEPRAHADAPARLRRVALARFDPRAWELGWDFEVLRQLEAEHARGLDPHWAGVLLASLERFCDEWRPADRPSWGEARAILADALAERGPARNHRVFAVGHTHLDTAWLWPLAETRRKFVRSVANQIALFDRYPEHRFSASSAQHYAWLSEDAPELFGRVRTLVGERRWMPLGGSWVESDCNLPSGESLVRQFLYGQRYFERELGVRCREHWGPDTFGHTGALPQILRSVGIDRWLTQKLSWNQVTAPPHHSFVWEGIDGSTVLAHMPPSNTCNAEMTVRELRGSVSELSDPDRSEMSLMMFGHGDGGGGPTPGMLEVARRVADLRGLPRVELGSSEAFFDRLQEDAAGLGRIVGELYLEFHRGTYTSQRRTKQGNRNGEVMLGEAEAAAALAARVAGVEHPAEELATLWRALLLHQFHDILAGTSIAEVHREAEACYGRLAERAGAIRDSALRALVGVDTGEVPASLAPFPRIEVTLDPAGTPVLVEAPAYGAGARATPRDRVTVRRESGSIVLENAALRVTLDERGLMTSLVERASGREALAAPGNRFELYEDRPTSYDAWELEPYHARTHEPCPGAESFEISSDGPLRAEVAFEHAVGERSRVRQIVRLDAHARRVELRATIDWGERHRILKALFPANVRSDSATYETAFGVHERPTHANTASDAARFEVPGHRFVDIGEHRFGLAILTDGTTGHSAAGAELRLSLLRGSTDPDPDADLGVHELVYALMPHSGSWQDAGVVREARLMNVPIRWVGGDSGTSADARRAAHSRGFAGVEAGDLVLDSLKRAEDSDALVARLYEPHGGRGVARIRIDVPFESATLANSLEEPLDGGELEAMDGTLSIPYRPFELITLILD
jgi:alpha-mannosidase